MLYEVSFLEDAQYSERDGFIQFFAISRGMRIRCMIPARPFYELTGARPGADPLSVFQKNRSKIEALAAQKIKDRDLLIEDTILIHSGDVHKAKS